MNEPRVVWFTQSGHVVGLPVVRTSVFFIPGMLYVACISHIFAGFEKHALASLAPAALALAALALDAADF
jgi:hypothetical protein